MSNVVIFLGAGASRQCGAPLMADFLDIASDLYRTRKVGNKLEQFEKVFAAIGALQAVHSKAQLDLTNIESVFTALELGRIIRRVPGMEPSDIGGAIAALKDVIVKTLEVTLVFPTVRSYIGVPRPYKQFAELIKYLMEDAAPSQSVSVVTFNYDIAADMALYRAGLGPDYVLAPVPQSHSPVTLLKLHGSLNWASEKSSKAIRPLHLHAYLSKYSYQGFEEHGTAQVPIGSHLSQYFAKHEKVEVDAEPVIVPPTWNKADYHEALSEVWSAAASHLADAESIFIMGYSLPVTDSFFRHLYALGSVGKAALRRLVVMNPDVSGVIDARFRELLGPGALARYEYRPLTFEQGIAHIKTLFPSRR